MNARNVSVRVLIILGLLSASCTKDTPAPTPTDADYLKMAIEMQGLDALKAGDSFSATYQATLMGAKIKGTLQQKTGAMRLEYVSPTPDQVIQVASESQCWQKIGRAVVSCLKPVERHTHRLGKLLRYSWLWPLKERKAGKIKPEKVTLGGKTYQGLTILEGDSTLGTLLFDTDTDLVAGLQMETTLMGESGLFVGTFSGLQKQCGVQIPTKREYTFKGQPFLSETFDGIVCEKIEEKVFTRPPQVKQGLVEIKNIASSSNACTKLKGPYTGAKGAMDKVINFLREKKLAPQGPMVWVHHRGPPKVKKESQYVTDICFPVGKKAWMMPESEWKGEVFLYHRSSDEYLRAFGVGGYDKTSQDLSKVLLDEAKKMKRKQAGPMVQIVYMRPDDFPPDQCVSEMFLQME